jgi:prepilin-type N-terminal cleavage/methylation domain-containing protein
MSNKLNKKGFTLLEMVVAMSIFFIFLTAIFNTFITITDTQKKANVNRESVAEAREVLEYISDETKDKSIDYSCYNDATCSNNFNGRNETDTIALISKDGLQRTVIQKDFNEEDQSYTISTFEQNRQKNNQEWQAPQIKNALHSPTLKIQKALFLISPDQDPFANTLEAAENNAIQYQPNLHLILNIKRKEADDELDTNPIVIETSLSSRIYNSF